MSPSEPAAITDLIIPALNEETNIVRLLQQVPPCFRHVIVADNGSTDATPDLARRHGASVTHEPQRGYGAACQAALRWIRQLDRPPTAVAFLDADLSDDPDHLPRLIDPIARDTCDLVIGSRKRRAEPGSLNLTQRVGNLTACTMMRILTGCRFSDLGPMRAIRWTSLEALGMTDRTWGWTVEMQYKAATLGLRCDEADVPYRRRQSGRSKISGSLVGATRAGSRILVTIGQLWWQQHRRPPRS